MGNNVAFQIHARCDFHQFEPLWPEFEHAAFGDIEHRLSQPCGAGTGKGDLLDFFQELANHALFQN